MHYISSAGFKLIKSTNDKGFLAGVGHFLVKALPIIIKALGIIGTIALLMVSGGIFVLNFHYFHDMLPSIPSFVKELGLGLIVGLLVVLIVTLVKKVLGSAKSH